MTVTHISVASHDEPSVEFRSDADLVVLHLDVDTSVSMKRAQWEQLRAQGGQS